MKMTQDERQVLRNYADHIAHLVVRNPHLLKYRVLSLGIAALADDPEASLEEYNLALGLIAFTLELMNRN